MTLLMATPWGVAIAGQPYPHLLFQLILSYSGWRYAEVATSETFPALQQGPQSDLWALGRVPEVVPSDNTSAATHEMRRRRGRALNDNYASLLEHYGLRSTRINRGQNHGNGVAEQGHYRRTVSRDRNTSLYAIAALQIGERRWSPIWCPEWPDDPG